MSGTKEGQQAEALLAEGKAAFERGDHAAARECLRRALELLRALPHAHLSAVADGLHGLADAALGRGDLEEARRAYSEALSLRQAIHGRDHISSARSLNGLGKVAYGQGNYAKARRIFEDVYSIYLSTLGEYHTDSAAIANNLGVLSDTLGDYAAAQTFHEQALAIRRRVLGEEHPDVALSLNNLGVLFAGMGDYATARTYYEQALTLRRRTLGEEHPRVATSLNNLGTVFSGMGDHVAARTFYEQALAIRRRTLSEEHPDVATSLNNLGQVSENLGDYAAAQTFHEQALAVRRRTLGEEHPDVASSLSNLGVLADTLGDYAAARTFYEQALAIRRRSLGEEHPDVASSLNNLGVLFASMGDHAAAQTFHEQALAIRRRALGEEHPDVAASLNNLGNVYLEAGDLAGARARFAASLDIIRRAFGDRHPDLIFTLRGLAKVALAALAVDEAILYLGQAVDIALLPDSAPHLAEVYRLLAKSKAAQDAPTAAIFFGKQAVNAIQSQRGRLKDLDPELQRSFLATKETAYRELADLLVEAGRLGEAQQVLAMLKEEELFDLLRRDAARDPRLTFAELTRLEAEWRRHGDALGADIVRLTEEVAALRKLAERTVEEEARISAARAELDAASRAFRVWLDGLRGELATSASPDDHSAEINLRLLERLQADLRALGPGVALLSYVVGENRLSLILTGESLQVSREGDLSASHLNRLVHEFRFALDQKLDEALVLGQALWRHLIAPVAPLLQQMRVETLMIVPYGTLRYLPFAALHDGEAYLAERFASSVLTLAAHASLRDPPRGDWQVAGFGVSREIPGYRQLRAVTDELAAIVRMPARESGVYPGVIRLDERFTEDSFADALEDHQAVHVASHFVLNPAQGLNSHLLLGDGGTLTLERLRDPRFDFHEVELVTLSACETAIGAENEDGREFEGFAALVQQRGAGAVIASLWPVADESTASFMAAFYRARRAGQNKAAALRGAQLALLRGNFPHPYHWAPFILMGNWL